MVQFTCPFCDCKRVWSDGYAGRSCYCPACSKLVHLPALAPPPIAKFAPPRTSMHTHVLVGIGVFLLAAIMAINWPNIVLIMRRLGL